MDYETDRLIWGGKVPVVFTLDPIERIQQGVANSAVDACYLLVPRCSYLPLCTEKLRKHFNAPLVQAKENELWFDYKGVPLKWNTPVGVLFDAMVSDALPWQITVHFRDYPEKTILRCTDLSILESYFINRVKEAVVLRHGTVQIDGIQSQVTVTLTPHAISSRISCPVFRILSARNNLLL
jgi:autophagy-related protein 5